MHLQPEVKATCVYGGLQTMSISEKFQFLINPGLELQNISTFIWVMYSRHTVHNNIHVQYSESLVYRTIQTTFPNCFKALWMIVNAGLPICWHYKYCTVTLLSCLSEVTDSVMFGHIYCLNVRSCHFKILLCQVYMCSMKYKLTVQSVCEPYKM